MDTKETTEEVKPDESFSLEELNKIREKTFNSELKNLVEKISSHEGNVKDDSDNFEENTEVQLPEEELKKNLLEKYHKLFYKTINLTNEYKVSTELNIFSDCNQSILNCCFNSLKYVLQELNIENYAFLFYSSVSRVFEPRLINMQEILEDKLTISPTEALYAKLIHSEKGLIINDSMFNNDLNLKKRFTLDDQSINSYYCVSLDQLLSDFWDQLDGISASEMKLHSLYPLLIVETNKKFNSDKSTMYQVLRNNVSFHLYIIYSYLRDKEISPEFRNSSYVSRMLDTHAQIMAHQKDLKCYILKYLDNFNNEIFLLMKFIYSKIYKLLSVKSSIRHIEKNKIIMFIHDDDVSSIENLILEFNKFYEDKFLLKQIDNYKHINLLDIMQF